MKILKVLATITGISLIVMGGKKIYTKTFGKKPRSLEQVWESVKDALPETARDSSLYPSS